MYIRLTEPGGNALRVRCSLLLRLGYCLAARLTDQKSGPPVRKTFRGRACSELMIPWKEPDVKAGLSMGSVQTRIYKVETRRDGPACPPLRGSLSEGDTPLSMAAYKGTNASFPPICSIPSTSSVGGTLTPYPGSPAPPPRGRPGDRPGAPGGPRRREARKRWSPLFPPPGQSRPPERPPRA